MLEAINGVTKETPLYNRCWSGKSHHVHMYVSVPPKPSVSKAVGRIKGKSALMIFDRHPEYRERYNRHFWARGYYCETVGNMNEETIKKYIAEQFERDRMEGDSGKNQRAAFKRSPVKKAMVCQTAFRRNSNIDPVGPTSNHQQGCWFVTGYV